MGKKAHFALIAAGVATVLVTVLRIVLMPQLQDSRTGDFALGFGIIGLMVVCIAAFAALAYADKTKPMPAMDSLPLRASAVTLMILGGTLLLEHLYDVFAYLAWHQTPSMQTSASGVDGLLLTGTIVFGLLAGVWALLQGYTWFTTERLCSGKYPLLALAFPLWMWMRLGRYVVSYASAVSVVETFYDYAMLVMALLFAMAFARYIAGQTNYQSPTVFWTALATVLCGVSSTCTRFVMYLVGETEAYRASQLARLTDLAVALFAAAVAVALVSSKKSIDESQESAPPASEGQNLLDELLPKE